MKFFLILLFNLYFLLACTTKQEKDNELVNNTSKMENLNSSSINSEIQEEKIIKYISWENVIWFINHEEFRLFTFDRMTEEENEYFGTYSKIFMKILHF